MDEITKDNKPSSTDREIVVSRVLDASRELVWEAWTNPLHVAEWWGPTGFTTTIKEMDVRPGGVWKLTMHGPDGTNYPNKSVFVEVVKPERIVFKHGGGKEGGGPSAQFVATWTFVEQGDQTQLTMRLVFETAKARDIVVKEYGAIEGGKQTLQRLADYLNGAFASGSNSDLVLTRTFEAPRETVFQAWTDPKQVSQWWGPKGFTNPVCEVDPRPGGQMMIHMRAPDGTVYPCKGLFREVRRPEKIVIMTSAIDDKGESALDVINTVTFEEKNNSTLLTLRAKVVRSTPIGKGYLKGQKQGWSETLERLGTLLKSS